MMVNMINLLNSSMLALSLWAWSVAAVYSLFRCVMNEAQTVTFWQKNDQTANFVVRSFWKYIQNIHKTHKQNKVTEVFY